MIGALVAIVLTLVLVVGIHEVGHALAAKLFSVKIQQISIGFGKPLFKWKGKSGCEWIWAIWPLGGYVQLLNSRIQPVAEKDFASCFDKQSVWVRCIILVSGALANLLIAWLALTFMFILGYQQNPPIIQTVIPQSIAAEAGLRAGDRFVEIAGQKTNSWQEVGMRLIMILGQNHVATLVVDVEGNLHQTSLNLSQWRYKKQRISLLNQLGIESASLNLHKQQVKGLPFLQAIYRAIDKSLQLLSFFIVMLKQLITGIIPFSMLLGPVGLLTASVGSFSQGLAVFLYFIASLSLAVGLVNLFPIPGLDGGSIVYVMIEKIRGKPVSVAMEVLLHRLAVIVFCLLLVQLLMNDLQRYLH